MPLRHNLKNNSKNCTFLCTFKHLGPVAVAPTSLNFKSYLSPDLRTIQPAVSGS